MDTKLQSQGLKKRIMRRIYAIWFVRRVLPLGASTGFFAYLALRETAQQFFVAKVVSNFLAVSVHMWSIPGFIGAAVRNAEPQTLFVIAFSIAATFVLSVKLLRSIRTIVAGSNQLFPSRVSLE